MAKLVCFAFSRSCVSPVLIAPENLASFNMHLHSTLCCENKVLLFSLFVAVAPNILFTCWLKPGSRVEGQISHLFILFSILVMSLEVVLGWSKWITPYIIEILKIITFSYTAWRTTVLKQKNQRNKQNTAVSWKALCFGTVSSSVEFELKFQQLR